MQGGSEGLAGFRRCMEDRPAALGTPDIIRVQLLFGFYVRFVANFIIYALRASA